MLVGRDRECALVDRLLERARAGAAGVLLVIGEAGMGKTALLDYAAESAGDMTVVRAVGIESEARLEFSGLFDICRPLLDRIEALPDRQRAALSGTLGLGPAGSLDRFSLGTATLTLVAAAAEDTPLLVLLDDAHWLDPASAEALLFAARRLVAERVALLVASREDAASGFAAASFETVALGDIGNDATAALLTAHASHRVAPNVAADVRRATGGSPLALVELAALLTPAQLSGAEPVPDPVPVGAAVESAFAKRAADLPDEARRALLVAALSSSGRVEPVVEALRLLGLDERALELGEDAALISLEGGRLGFRHPLVRSAVVQGAAASDRRQVHRALADAMAGHSQEQRAWHLAAAALGPDQEAADALADAALRTRARSGWGSAASMLERAARLTPDPKTRRPRLLDAAESAWVAGRIELTLALTQELLADGGTGPGQSQAMRLRSQMELHCGDVGWALDHLLEAAGLLERDDPSVAIALLADAVEAAELVGEPGRALDAARHAARLAGEDVDDAFVAEFALGQALRLQGRPRDARAHLERAVRLLGTSDELGRSMRACSRGAYAAGWLGLMPDGLELARRATEAARDQRAFGPLGHALAVSSWLAACSGRWREARAQASEGLERARESRCAWASTSCLEELAWLAAAEGSEQACRTHAAQATEVAARAGFRSERARLALGMLELGVGRAHDAISAYDEVGPTALLQHNAERGAGLVEAHVRSGQLDQATAAYERMPTVEGDALAARCRGLLATEDAFEAPFREALDLHSEHEAFGVARTRLCFGERLRRAGRRVDARTELRAAHEVFDRLGARPWVARAAGELRATGERLGRRQARTGEELTAQELQVALQAADGKTNKEVGAALFLSPKTVDFHLRRVYRKLDVRTRAELVKHFAGAARNQS